MKGQDRNLAALRGVPSLVWGSGQQRRLDMIVRQANLHLDPKLSHALVNGCGVGQYAAKFAPYFHHVVGIDIEPAYLAHASQAHRDLLLSRAPCEQLPLPDQAFDLVLSHEVLEHVRDDRLAMEEMVRVTKPGGYVVLFVPNRWFPFETHGFYWDDQYYWGNIPLVNYLPALWRDQLAPHVRTYDNRALRHLIRDLPVRILAWTQIWPGLDALGHSFPSGQRLLRAVRTVCENSPLRILGISHCLVLRRDP